MRIAQIASVCSTVMLFWGVPRALALPKLQMHPVELLGYDGDAVRLAVELPCGGKYYGLIAQADSKGKNLKLAAAIAVDAIICTGMPEMVEVRVDYLATRSFLNFSALPVQDGARLTLARITELHVVTGGKLGSKLGSKRLTALYEPRCGRDQGVLIHHVGKDRLELAFVETPRDNALSQPCAAGQKSRRIGALDMGAHVVVAPLRDKPKSFSRSYTLALAPIREGSVQPLNAKTATGIHLAYQRRCNEAPVGLVLSQPSQGASVQLGMLVARYMNYPCARPNKTGKEEWAQYEEQDLTLPRPQSPGATGAATGKAMAATEVEARDSQPHIHILGAKPNHTITTMATSPADAEDELRLGAPLSVTREVARLAGDLKVNYFGTTCDEAYAVYARDWTGALAVGVLTRGAQLDQSGSSQCKSLGSEVSLVQPYVALQVPVTAIHPMRLKGLVAH